MVAYQTVSIGGVELKLEPTGSRRLFDRIHFPIPYFHFQKPKWKLCVKRLQEPEQTRKIYWFLRLGDGRATGHEINLPSMQPGEVRRFEVGDRLISPIGVTSFCVTIPEWLQKGQHPFEAMHHTLCTFRSTAEEEYFMEFSAGFLASLLVALLIYLFLGGTLN